MSIFCAIVAESRASMSKQHVSATSQSRVTNCRSEVITALQEHHKNPVTKEPFHLA
jgi:hypothetical protein